MATGIQNAITIELDATASTLASYTLPRAGRVVDVLIQDIAGIAGNITATLAGSNLFTVALALPASADALVRAVSIVDSAADGAAGEALVFSSSGFGSRYKVFVTFLTPVVV